MTSDTPKDPPVEQSMDDILASIRRIMVDEEARLKGHVGQGEALSPPPVVATPLESVPPILTLDDSMVVEDLPPAPTPWPPQHAAATVAAPTASLGWGAPLLQEGGPQTEERPDEPAGNDVPWPVEAPALIPDEVTLGGGQSSPMAAPPQMPALSPLAIEALVAPAAAAAAAASVEALMRELSQSRSLLNTPTAPTIEDVVRGEIRPLLKAWLDEHLPTMVERLVRAEIERLVSRSMH
jgi:cell pole-organizing protein PopZ